MRWPRVIQIDDHELNMRTLLSNLPTSMERRGVIHIGAHKGEEVPLYREFGFKYVTLIEANPDNSKDMAEKFSSVPQISVINKAIADETGEATLHIHTSRSGSTEPASLLPLHEFKYIVESLHTPIQIRVPMSTLDNLIMTNELDANRHNLLVIDVQGAELMVLRGAQLALKKFDAVIAEVAMRPLYEGAAMEQDVITHLSACGFRPIYSIDHEMYRGEDREENRFVAWGECLFSRC